LGRKVLQYEQRSTRNHAVLTKLLSIAKIGNIDVARLFNCSETHVGNILRDPYQMDLRKIVALAGMLSVSPEYLVYVIRFNNLYVNKTSELNSEFAPFHARFGTS